jgi:hypothetical protein
MTDKILVTNGGALDAKYGPNGVARVRAALAALIAADAQRGITTKLIELDDAAALAGAPVTDVADPKQNKDAIDAVFRALTPDYIALFGAPDIVPHQDLTNPLYQGPAGSDLDPIAYSDLPYACDAPYSRDTTTFLGPTRVVGRIPDLARAPSDGTLAPDYAERVLALSTGWTERPVDGYRCYFGLSAAAWEASTRLSVEHAFGSSTNLRVAPGGPYPDHASLERLAFYINCHGSDTNPKFYGQSQGQFPVALTATDITDVPEGAVASVECCYGAQLYAPSRRKRAMGVANAFMQAGGCGYFGSTTEAFGPATGNSHADVICQAFMVRLLTGASLGRAVAEARHDFIEGRTVLDPVDLKTLAQFLLLGDPSVRPVAPDVARRHRRGRPELVARGRRLRTEAAYTPPETGTAPSPTDAARLDQIAADAGLTTAVHRSFDVIDPTGAPETRVHLVMGPPRTDADVPAAPLLVVSEQAGEVSRVEHLFRH